MDRTIKGVNVSVDPRALTDARAVRLLRDVIRASRAYSEGQEFDVEDMMKFYDLFDFVLGDQADRVIKELGDEDGFTSTEVIGQFISELFSSEKNS